MGSMALRTFSWNKMPAVYNPPLSGIAGSALVFTVKTNVKGKNKNKTKKIQLGRDPKNEAENNFTE